MNYIHYIALCATTAFGTSTFATEIDSLKSPVVEITEDTTYTNFSENLDGLTTENFVLEDVDTAEVEQVAEFIDFPDSVYIERLSKIPSVVPLPYNKVVKRYIDVYTRERRDKVETMISLSKYYFPIFDEIFDYHGVPNEMKYMSIIESALNPLAYSRTRAVGLWQFMYGTGKMYGLEVNSYVDDRRDPMKSTHAAAEFSADLYKQFNDWLLVIAAYNCGPGNVRKAMRRSGGKKDYWDIYYRLPRETRGHVPAFIAATYVMHYYHEHGIVPADTVLPLASDTVMIGERLHFGQVSELIGISQTQLKQMNPQYRYNIIPGDIRPYPLRIPSEKLEAFIDVEDTIYAYNKSKYFDEQTTEQVKQPTYTKYTPQAPGSNYEKLYYTVKSGDNLGYIAEWYQVRASQLRYWNNMNHSFLRVGQKLVVYVPNTKIDKYKSINSMSFEQKQEMIGVQVQKTNQNIIREDETGQFEYYTVKNGDTIWEIAKKYPGVSDSDILRLNNMTSNSKIVPGQRLKIKTKG